MNEDFGRVADPTGHVVEDCGVQLSQAAAGSRSEHALRGCFGEDLHRNGVMPILQSVPEARLVVHEVALAPGPQQFISVDLAHIPRVTEPCPCMMAKSLRRAKKDCT